MWPAILGAVIGGGLSLLGGERRNEAQMDQALLTNQFNAEQAALNRTFQAEQAGIGRDFSAEQAARQMEFQERMSGTAWQRAIADMEAAGLNPMLAYSQGGAHSPGGAMGSAGLPSGSAAHGVMPNLENTLAGAVSSGAEAARTVSDLLTAEQNRQIKGPLETLATAAAGVLDELKKVIAPIAESVSGVVQKIEDRLKELPVDTAAGRRAVKEAVETVDRAVEQVRDVMRNPGRVAGKVVSSAEAAGRKVVDTVKEKLESVYRWMGDLVHGKRGVEPPPSKGKVPREAQERLRRYEWKFNYSPGR